MEVYSLGVGCLFSSVSIFDPQGNFVGELLGLLVRAAASNLLLFVLLLYACFMAALAILVMR